MANGGEATYYMGVCGGGRVGGRALGQMEREHASKFLDMSMMYIRS